jgi:outer membrane murein-binding lipoprotein Lpp
MSDADLHAEIEALRREIAAMRAEQVAAKSGAAKAEEAIEAGAATLTEQLRGLAREISDLTEETEKGVVAHPLTSVLAALVLGVLIGRVLPR